MTTDKASHLSRLAGFLKTGIWRVPARDLPKSKAFLLHELRVLVLAARGFNEDKCHLRASALTFYSLLSLVPLLALAFGVSKGFGIEQRLEGLILRALPNQQEVAVRIIDYAHSFLENAQGGVVAGVGVAVLIWAVIQLLGHIEECLNDIWGVRKGRSLGRKFTDYLSIMIIAPLLLVMASSATVVISTHAALLANRLAFLESAGPLLTGLLNLLPYGAVWILFTLVYMLMPNTRVTLKSGLLAGILAGTAYQIVQWIYIEFQVGVSTYNAVYGSFAALPLFLVWMQTSWLVVLLGAEISFAAQNAETFAFAPRIDKVSHRLTAVAALRLTQLCVQDFRAGKSPRTAEHLAEALEVPIRFIRRVLSELVDARILSEVLTDEEGVPAYQPARAIDSLTVVEVINRLLQSGVDEMPYGESQDWEKLSQRLTLFEEAIRNASADIALEDL